MPHSLIPHMTHLSAWIVEALRHAHIGQAEAARLLTVALGRNVDRAAVNKMTKGKRPIFAEELLEIAKMTNYPLPTADLPAPVPLIGKIGLGSEMNFSNKIGSSELFVEGYQGQKAGTVAFEIGGGCLGAALNGWIAYYDDVSTAVTSDMIGELCVVWLENGSAFLKIVELGSRQGLFTLRSNFEPPAYDIRIVRVARVRHMRPGK